MTAIVEITTAEVAIELEKAFSLSLPENSLLEIAEYAQEEMLWSSEERNVHIRKAAEWFGHLDTKGDCPVCGKSGWIGAKRHEKCHQQIMKDGLCSCGAPATNTRHWHPTCQSCADHQDHLDALAD